MDNEIMVRGFYPVIRDIRTKAEKGIKLTQEEIDSLINFITICDLFEEHAPITQSGECQPYKLKVPGSSPGGRTTKEDS